MAVVVRFLVLTRVVPFILILSEMAGNVRELTLVFLVFLHLKGVVAYGILNNFFISGENHWIIRNSDSEGTFFKVWYILIVKIIGYFCPYEFVQGYY